MGSIGKPPYRRGSKASDIKVGIIGGAPSLQANWGGRIYSAPLFRIGASNILGETSIGGLRILPIGVC